jgi:hypothetical protein
VAHEVLQQRELPAGEVYLPVFAPDAARQEVYLQVVRLYLHRSGLVGAAGQGPDAGQQLLEREGLGQVVVRAGVEGDYLVLQVVAGGQHQDRQVRTPQPDAPEDLLAAHSRQRDVQQHHVDRLLDRQPHAVLAVIRAEDPVAVGVQALLQKPHYRGLVLDDQY